MGLQLRNKTPKRKVKAKLREDRVQATAPNECWSMDFLSDQLFDGRKIRVLAIIDNFTRLSPALDVRHSYKGSDVVDTLERIAADYGRPRRVRVDNGPEFISKDLDFGLISMMSYLTSAGPVSLRITPMSNHIMAAFGRNA